MKVAHEGPSSTRGAASWSCSARTRFRTAALLAALALPLVTVSCSNAGGVSASAIHQPVLLLPDVTGGVAGWCITRTVRGGCQIESPGGAAIVGEAWGSQYGGMGGESSQPATEGFALTTSDVAAVSVDGSSAIPTRREPELPAGLRAVVVAVRGGPVRKVSVPRLFGGKPRVLLVPKSFPRFTPLNSNGRAIAQRGTPPASLAFRVPGRGWSHPAVPTYGLCRIRALPLHGLEAPEGFVVTRLRPRIAWRGRPFRKIARPYLSCASNSYNYSGWPLVASVLIDAMHPGVAPASFLGMKPLPGHPGAFQALCAQGEMVARRIRGAWLIVANGRDNAQRMVVLEHLRADVHL